MLAIPWYFTGVIHRTELFGQVYFIVTAATLVWGLYAGTLIDKYNRHRIFLAMNVSGLFILSAVAAFGFKNQGLHWLLVAGILATTTFIYNIHYPNLYAFAQQITAKKDYSRVTSLLEIQGQITFTIAGGVAALLLNGVQGQINFAGLNIPLPFSFAPWKIYEIFALDAATYLVAFVIIFRIKSLPVVVSQVDLSSLRDRVKTGFNFLSKNPLLFIFGNASLLVFLTVLIFSAYVQPPYVEAYLHKGGDVFGFGEMTFSLGAVLAGFITTKLFAEKSAVKGIISLSIIAACMYLLMAASSSVALFFAANFVIGACNAAVRIQRITYLFHHIPNRVIGRASGVFFMVNVLLRLCLIATFTLPFFHRGTHILYAVTGLGLVCFTAAAVLTLNYKRLLQAPEVE